MSNKEQTLAVFDVRNFFKRWPRFYYAVGTIFGPMFFSGLSAKSFLKRYGKKDSVIINIGSGPRVISPEVINIDIHPYHGVNIVAESTKIPLPSESVDLIISDNVLEHLREPLQSVEEMKRLLREGGLIYVSIPYLYPFHSSPSDYQRWTKEGILELFGEFEVLEIGVRAGPFSALTVFINHFLSIVFSFGSPRIASILLNCVMFLTFPIKLLDIVFHRFPSSSDISAMLYAVVRK